MAIDLTSNCLLQLKMNENEDSFQVFDSSGNDNHGTAQRITASMHSDSGNPPNLNGALNLNGTSDKITLSSQISLSGFWTIGFWGKWTDNSGRPNFTVGRDGDNNNYFYFQKMATEELKFRNNSGTEVIWNGLSVLNGWHWFTLISVNDGTQLQLFIDNNYISTKTINTDFDFDLISEGGNGGPKFEGDLDCLNVFDRNLTEDERNFLWNGGDGTENLSSAVRPLVCGSLVGNSLIGKGLV